MGPGSGACGLHVFWFGAGDLLAHASPPDLVGFKKEGELIRAIRVQELRPKNYGRKFGRRVLLSVGGLSPPGFSVSGFAAGLDPFPFASPLAGCAFPNARLLTEPLLELFELLFELFPVGPLVDAALDPPPPDTAVPILPLLATSFAASSS